MKKRRILILSTILLLATMTIAAIYYYAIVSVEVRQHIVPSRFEIDFGILYTGYSTPAPSGIIEDAYATYKTWKTMTVTVRLINYVKLGKCFDSITFRVHFDKDRDGVIDSGELVLSVSPDSPVDSGRLGIEEGDVRVITHYKLRPDLGVHEVSLDKLEVLRFEFS